MGNKRYGYHYGREAEKYAFYRIPKALFSDREFKDLSTDAKLLYGMMLDRLELSMKNDWIDEYGRVYIYFTITAAMKQLHCGHTKVVKLFRSLGDEGIGLIERRQSGQGKPCRIFVKKFIADGDASHTDKGSFQPSGKRKARIPQSGSLGVRKAEANDTDIKKTERRKNPLSFEDMGESL